jgi:Penicillin amidase
VRKIFLSALAIGLVSAAAATPSWAKYFAKPGLDIIPSGQYGSVPQPAGATQQADMYNALTPLFNHVSAADMNRDFKPMTIGTATPGPTSTETIPHPGVTVVRDAFDVPHIFGQTRDDVTWGAGWVIAEDRGLLLQEARYDSLVAAIDAPGLSALGLVSSLESFKPSLTSRRVASTPAGTSTWRKTSGRSSVRRFAGNSRSATAATAA